MAGEPKTLALKKMSTLQEVTDMVAAAFFPNGISSDGDVLQDNTFFIARHDLTEKLPQFIEGQPFTFGEYRKKVVTTSPLRLYLYTKKVSQMIIFINPLLKAPKITNTLFEVQKCWVSRTK